MRLRKVVFSIHRIIGLSVGLLFAIAGLTGSVIVFRTELDHSFNAALMHVSPQAEMGGIDSMLAAVQSAHPNLPFWFILFPKTPEDALMVAMKTANGERIETYVNPYTAEVLGSRVWERSLVGFLHTLHYTLFLKTPGRMAMAVVGVLFLLTAIAGAMLWTGWRNLKTGFKIRWHAATPLLSFDLHNVGGILSAALLCVLAFTGVVITTAQLILGGQAAAKPIPPEPPVLMSQLLQKANAAMPEGKISVIEFVESQPTHIHVHKKLPEQKTGDVDFSAVELDRFTGEILKVERVIEPNPVFKVLLTVVNLHYGKVGGLPTRILYVFIGLMPTVLFITSLILWRRRQGLESKRQAAQLLASMPDNINR